MCCCRACRPTTSRSAAASPSSTPRCAFCGDRVEREPRRKHQALLRAADGDVDFPLVVAIVDRAERGDGVDHEQRRMAGAVDRVAHVLHAARHAGRGLVVHDAHRFDLAVFVGFETRGDRLGIGAVAPVAGDHFDVEARVVRPPCSTAPRTGRPRTSARCRPANSVFTSAASQPPLPEAGHTISGPVVLKIGLVSAIVARGELAEGRTAVIDRRAVDRAEHALRNVRRTGDLQKMDAADVGHELSSKRSV